MDWWLWVLFGVWAVGYVGLMILLTRHRNRQKQLAREILEILKKERKKEAPK